jgi:hypothetical protein
MYGIRAMQRDAAFRSDASGSCRVDSTEDFRFNSLKQNHARQLRADNPGKQRALVTRRTVNPALMTFAPANLDLLIDNVGICNHNSAAPALADR